jgi:large subunit ribosomal protein L6
MSRVAKQPINLPANVKAELGSGALSVTGINGSLKMQICPSVEITLKDGVMQVSAKSLKDKHSKAMSGTTRALVANMVKGVTEGFERKLELIGVGYRAKASNNALNLTLGFSHPVDYLMPEGVTVETPSQTEILLKSCDKRLLGEVAAKIRSFRPPEPYKGKGVRYANETVLRKEAKKK